MNSLSLRAMAGLPPAVVRPAYDPARVTVGIVHLGLGAFHRAHQAVYTDDVLARDPRWGICGVSLKTPRAVEPLVAQDGLYTVLTKGSGGTVARVIGSVREALFAGANRAGVIERFADPRIAIVTATVTEKGYCHDPATGALNRTHPDIVHDLGHPDRPESAVGILTAGLAARRSANAGPLTLVCCDNLPHNGRMVEGLVFSFARERDPALADWIRSNVAFPCSMVDRIVPATTAADIAEAERLLGVHDAAPVAAEAFGQWVIEDRFAGARPAWEQAGAQIVADVAPFETMKLRLLNGSHSTLAYLGFLMGHDFVWQAAADPLLALLVERQMAEEIAPTLVRPAGTDLQAYGAQLMQRFRNSALPHRTKQIAMDGSQKLPQRLLGTIRDNLAAGRPIACAALAVAGWMRYASGADEAGNAIMVSDPLAPELARIAAAHRGDPPALARGLLGLTAIFGGDLPADPRFVGPVTAWLSALFTDGAARTVAHAARAG
jgi:fructuronate reductase